MPIIDDKVAESAEKQDAQLFGQNITRGDKHRKDWQVHHALIRDAVLLLMKMTGKFPTYKQISLQSGLSENTVKKHMKELKLDQQLGHHIKISAVLADEIMYTVIKSARSGNMRAVELYLQLVFGWSRNQRVELEPTKELRTPEDIERLSNDALRRIRASSPVGA